MRGLNVVSNGLVIPLATLSVHLLATETWKCTLFTRDVDLGFIESWVRGNTIGGLCLSYLPLITALRSDVIYLQLRTRRNIPIPGLWKYSIASTIKFKKTIYNRINCLIISADDSSLLA